MYQRFEIINKVKCPTEKFLIGVEGFIHHAKEHPEYMMGIKIKCPCVKCRNVKYLHDYEVRNHLIQNGFCPNYYEWVCHGEKFCIGVEENVEMAANPYRDMVRDALEDRMMNIMEEPPLEGPDAHTKPFFDMLKAAENPLYQGSKMTVLEAAARVVTLKSEYNLPHKCVDGIASLIEDVIPPGNLMSRTFYDTKKVVKGLELPCEKIHACPNGCMLFWGNEEDVDATNCKKCLRERYKSTSKGKKVSNIVLTYFPIGPRLQRLYAAKKIATHMRWH